MINEFANYLVEELSDDTTMPIVDELGQFENAKISIYWGKNKMNIVKFANIPGQEFAVKEVVDTWSGEVQSWVVVPLQTIREDIYKHGPISFLVTKYNDPTGQKSFTQLRVKLTDFIIDKYLS